MLSRSSAYKFCVEATYGTEATEKFEKRVHTPKFKKVAIVLSGCGVFDGSEVTEVVSLMVHLNRMHVDFQCFAPNEN